MKTKPIAMVTLLLGLIAATSSYGNDPLPSWNETDHKQAIISFVEAVTEEGNPDFVPETYRVATFDQDGTIFIEKPLVVLFEHLYNFFETQESGLVLVGREPGEYDFSVSNEVLLTAYKGYTVDQYNEDLLNFVKTTNHPRFNVPYFDLFYQPMLELIQYLRSKNFRVYIVSGSWQIFVRSVVGEKTGLRRSNMIGTQTKLAYEDGEIKLAGALTQPVSNLEAKPEYIENNIGVKPILAFGNTLGDYQMFEYTSTNERRHLVMWLEHDDGEREYEYASHIEGESGWLKISMKNDFSTVFGNSSEQPCVEETTWGKDPSTGIWSKFNFPCDVPAGWEVSKLDPGHQTGIDKCKADPASCGIICDGEITQCPALPTYQVASGELHIPLLEVPDSFGAIQEFEIFLMGRPNTFIFDLDLDRITAK
jgi:phosphoserine phosphatase